MSRVIVTIHGTGRTDREFWVPQVRALAEHLGQPPPHRSVWWGDVIDAGACVSRFGAWIIQHVHALTHAVLGRPSRHIARGVASGADVLHRLVNGVDGVLAYFTSLSRREIIRERLRRTLAELTDQGHEIVLVSESLGCLVAFDVLHGEADRYNIVAWITLGCALRILVHSGQRDGTLGAINPHTVKQWWNLYAPRDPVAAPIASVFPAYPICDEPVDGAPTRLQAHRYWTNPRVIALIARLWR